MAFANLDSAPALIVVDLQKCIPSFPTIHPFLEIVDRANQLTAAFRQHGYPVVLVHVTGTAPGRAAVRQSSLETMPDWTELVRELSRAPGDIIVSKRCWGAFHCTSLDATLRARRVTQVVMAGVATSKGIESTARSAHDLGYNVMFVRDAVTDVSVPAHNLALDETFPIMGELATTTEILSALASRP